MRDDFDIISYDFNRERNIKILPIGDIHLGSAECDYEAFGKFCKDVIKDPDAYVCILGDLFDTATKQGKSDIFSQSMNLYEAKDLATRMLQPLADAGRILAWCSGNHEKRIYKSAIGDYPDYDVACRLRIEDVWRPNACFLLIRFDDKTKAYRLNGTERPTYSLCLTHGSTTNKGINFAYAVSNIDVLCLGHTHQPSITKHCKIVVDKSLNKVREESVRIVTSGSWLNYGGYALSAMYRPGAKCLDIIHLKGRKKQITITQV